MKIVFMLLLALITSEALNVKTTHFTARQIKYGENFTRNGGIIDDNHRGLQWQDAYAKEDISNSKKREYVFNIKGGNQKLRTHKNAIDYCEKLELDDFKDWRLPSKEEIRTTIDYKAAKNTHRVAFYSTFIQVKAWNYWVSENQMSINFQNAYLEHLSVSRKAFVRCVRGENKK